MSRSKVKVTVLKKVDPSIIFDEMSPIYLGQIENLKYARHLRKAKNP